MKHKSRCLCCKRGEELERQNKVMRDALKAIAKPALGGKSQQWHAQHCLDELAKSGAAS